MTPIRPAALPPQTATPASADAGRLAAQRAFFDAARGVAPAPAPTALATTASTVQAAFTPAQAPVPRPQRLPDPAAEAPTRVLRPGSLLDIRI